MRYGIEKFVARIVVPDSAARNLTRRPSVGALYVVMIAVAGIVYVSQAWTPSSYALALQMLGVKNTGLVAGQPRWIRSDEWAVWTPYVQIAVNNHFDRYNAHSPYHEDLRNFNALPLRDWSLLFKPQCWGFFLISPAYAFSFSHAFLIIAFLIGYYRLARDLGICDAVAICFSLTLFFTSFSQFTWTTYGPALALFPWILIAFLSGLRMAPKALLIYYLTTVWLLSHLYPPVIISLAFTGVVMIAAFRPDSLRHLDLVVVAIAVAAAGTTVYLYLAEPFGVMADTVYPGQRRSHGGEESWRIWLSTLLPFITTSGFEPLGARNIVEAGSAGSYWPLMLLIFADARSLFAWTRDWIHVRVAAIVGAGLLAISAWMLLPIPTEVGRFLLWDRVPPHRMLFALGLLALVPIAVVAQNVRWRLTWLRMGLFSGIVIAAWLWSKWSLGASALASWFDLAVLAILGVVVALKRHLGPERLAWAVAAAAAATNIVTFGQFNPIQSARPIFDRPETAVTASLRQRAARQEKGWLVLPYPGAVLAGWGFSSIGHVLIAPQLDFFRRFFPNIPSADFDRVFNKYAHIRPSDVAKPTTVRDVIEVPANAFGVARSERPAVVITSGVPKFARGGSLDWVVYRDGLIELHGWAPWDGFDSHQRLAIITSFPVEVVSTHTEVRPDVIAAFPGQDRALAGFVLFLRPLFPLTGEVSQLAFCVLAEGAGDLPIALSNRSNPATCNALLAAPDASPR